MEEELKRPNLATIKSWDDAFDKWREKGCDLSDAAFRADQWEKRNVKPLDSVEHRIADSGDNLVL